MALVETKILASTALIFGTVSFILFVIPFFLYFSKMKDQSHKNDGPLKLIGEVAFLHIAMVIMAVIMTGAVNGIMIKPDFKPENGLLYFYGMASGGTAPMWEFWLAKSTAIGGASMSAKDADFMKAFVLSMQYYSLFIFLTYAMIPIIIVWNTFSSLTSENDIKSSMSVGGQGAFWQDYLTVAKGAFLKFFFTVFIVLFHMSLASLYVSIFVSDFSHYEIMSALWHVILT